jgi:hypothetical protein
MARDRDQFERAKVAPPPKSCGVDGCDGETAVAIAVAVVYGTVRTGAGSEFLENGAPKQGVQFERYICRCADCYIRELYRARRGQRSEIMGTQYEWDIDTLRQYWRDNGLDEPRKVA